MDGRQGVYSILNGGHEDQHASKLSPKIPESYRISDWPDPTPDAAGWMAQSRGLGKRDWDREV